VLLAVGRDASTSAAQVFGDAMAASPIAAAGSSSSSSSSSSGGAAGEQQLLLALVASAADGSSMRVSLVDAATGTEAEAADVPVPPPAYPVAGPPAHVVAVWLDASRRGSSSGGTGAAALHGCRLLVLWSDDQLSFVEGGQQVWMREEGLASGVTSLMVDLPAARAADKAAAAAAAAAGDTGADSASSASTTAALKQGGGVLGLVRDREVFKRWARLQVLSVLIQFKLNTGPEREEFLQLRQSLRCERAHGYKGTLVRACVACQFFILRCSQHAPLRRLVNALH
jgi:hypothetical protein